MQKIGLLAPAGEVDKVLQTVVNNLLVTNNIDLQSDVRCRVLLTSPLESFNIGHTIVMSRGLLDVLPDEASLAMVLSHELAHIVLGHRLDTQLAYNDKLGNAGLFLKALQLKAPDLPHLIRSHLGDSLAGGKSMSMSTLLAEAP